jgi:hypothetical protein
MKESIRMTVDSPAPLYRKLKEQAAAQGRSLGELLLTGTRSVVLEEQRPRPRRVRFPLIMSEGLKIDPPNDEIYEPGEFP